MSLTREQTIKEHRKMWRWISENLQDCDTVESVKDRYLSQIAIEPMLNGCFLCEWVSSNNKNDELCNICPIDWGEFNCKHGGYGEFYKQLNLHNISCAKRIALYISELSERKENK